MSKTKQHTAPSSTHERLNETGKKAVDTAKSVATDELKKGVTSAWEQVLGLQKTDAKATMHKSEVPQRKTDIWDMLTFTRSSRYENQRPETKTRAEAHMNYGAEIAKSSERAQRVEMSELQQQIQAIKAELSQLVHSSKILNNEFKELAVEITPPSVGDYHMKFFEWMLLVIQQARQKVEDSGSWVNAVRGKNSKRGFSDMSKKHGTSFTLSGERTTATQTG